MMSDEQDPKDAAEERPAKERYEAPKIEAVELSREAAEALT